MSKSVRRVFSREFKVLAVRRMLAGDSPMAVARELGALRKDLYLWRNAYQKGGAEGLVGRGRPRKVMGASPAAVAQTGARNAAAPKLAPDGAGKRTAAPPGPTGQRGPAGQRGPEPGPLAAAHAEALARIAELERKVGQQQLELDFFQRALRQVEVTRATRVLPGGTGSTRSSKP